MACSVLATVNREQITGDDLLAVRAAALRLRPRARLALRAGGALRLRPLRVARGALLGRIHLADLELSLLDHGEPPDRELCEGVRLPCHQRTKHAPVRCEPDTGSAIVGAIRGWRAPAGGATRGPRQLRACPAPVGSRRRSDGHDTDGPGGNRDG